MSNQEQFLDVIDRDEAERRFRTALVLEPLGAERIALAESLGRVLSEDVVARVDVPSFDRSNFDGFAVRAADTFGASELAPKHVRLLEESLDAGTAPTVEVNCGEAVSISTGGMIPRGADAILMVEHAEVRTGVPTVRRRDVRSAERPDYSSERPDSSSERPDSSSERADDSREPPEELCVLIRRAVTPGHGVSFAGTDIATGETVLRVGTVLTSRETGVLAALGENTVAVWRRPRVAIISTGNEIIAPGQPMRPAAVYDSNSQVLADAVRELGGQPRFWGIVRDDVDALRTMMRAALAESDLVLLSGGTSKGKGDLCYRVVAELTDPGIVAHGVALKPGKPLCLAVTDGKPVVILPGFPTSAIFTFHEFVAPVIRLLGGRPPESHETVSATMAVKANSEIGRTEYLLVGLVHTDNGLSAFPMGKGSGSVTTFSRADGFVTIPRHTEIVEAGASVEVRLIGRDLHVADLVVIGSHCVGLDFLLSQLQRRGVTSKLLTVGSSAGLLAAKRSECDIAGIHLLDPNTGEYNRPYLSDAVELIEGYGRSQGIVFRRGDPRFEGQSLDEIVARITGDDACVMVSRNQGSGTRILIDRLLAGAKPPGYAVQPTNHNAVAAAIAQHRADWGLAIESVARANGLGFISYQEERYDFVVPKRRVNRPAVQAFVALLKEPAVRERLRFFGFRCSDHSSSRQTCESPFQIE
jgi:putative molybdopterin biosynthesis protein